MRTRKVGATFLRLASLLVTQTKVPKPLSFPTSSQHGETSDLWVSESVNDSEWKYDIDEISLTLRTAIGSQSRS